MLALLIRHGETDDNRARCFLGQRDPALNERGRAQAASMAGLLAGKSVEAIYSSDLRRAAETAAIIGERVKESVRTEPALRELDVGLLDGLGIEEGLARFPAFFAEWRARPGRCRMPEGESLHELRERAWSALLTHAERHPTGTVVFVTHTFVVLVLVCKVLGLPLDRFRRLYLHTGALTVVRIGEGRPSLLAFDVRADGGWYGGSFR